MTAPEQEQEMRKELARQAEGKFLDEYLRHRNPVFRKQVDAVRDKAHLEINFGSFQGKHTGENITREFRFRFPDPKAKGGEINYNMGRLTSEYMKPENRKAAGYEGWPLVEAYDEVMAGNSDGWRALEEVQLQRQIGELEEKLNGPLTDESRTEWQTKLEQLRDIQSRLGK